LYPGEKTTSKSELLILLQSLMREQEEKKKVGMNIHDVSIATSIKKKIFFAVYF
jgi:hypothetical protein